MSISAPRLRTVFDTKAASRRMARSLSPCSLRPAPPLAPRRNREAHLWLQDGLVVVRVARVLQVLLRPILAALLLELRNLLQHGIEAQVDLDAVAT